MRSIIAFFLGILIAFIVGLSGYWLYYQARYQVVYVQSIPYIHDRWTDTVKIAGDIAIALPPDTTTKQGVAAGPKK
jgi:hypothetical protein